MACNGNNHKPDCTCGWGGEDTGGGGFHSTAANPNVTFWPYALASDCCKPTSCPICKKLVFFLRHNGGSAWFDDLGVPWPKHSCFDRAGGKPIDPARFAVFYGKDTTAKVTTSLLFLTQKTPDARVGIASKVVQVGPQVRVLTVNLSDGTTGELLVEAKTPGGQLAGALVVYSLTSRWAAALLPFKAVYGWWFDKPPGAWVDLTPLPQFFVGALTYHKDIGVGVVIEASGTGDAQKVKIRRIDGSLQTVMANKAKFRWMEPSGEKHVVEVPLPHTKVTAFPSPTRVVAAPKPPSLCPNCGVSASKMSKHLKKCKWTRCIGCGVKIKLASSHTSRCPMLQSLSGPVGG